MNHDMCSYILDCKSGPEDWIQC